MVKNKKTIATAINFRKATPFRLIILFLCLTSIFLITFYWTSISSFILPFDLSILTSINHNRIRSLDLVFVFIADASSYIAIGIIILVFILSTVRKSATLKRKGWQLLFSFLLAVILTVSLKYSFNRFRPLVKYKQIEKLVETNTPAFPSGHTLQAFAMATALILLFKNKILFVIALLWALAVTLSRLVLGVHFPSDVIGGMVISISSSYVCHFMFIRRYRQ